MSTVDRPPSVETVIEQANVLLSLKRYADAEQMLGELLARFPDDPRVHVLFGYTLYLRDRPQEALRQAETAIGLDPNLSGGYYVRAMALLELDQIEQAIRAIKEALRLDPQNASYHGALAHIYGQKKDWKRSLAAAEEGLRLDPENTFCANMRGIALTKLGRHAEAGETIKKALARNPESALTQATQGWALLHRGDHRQALVHFREALRLDPMSDWARAGIVEALKARYLLYRWLLRYFLWVSRLTRTEQGEMLWIVSGVWRALRIIARQVPMLYLILVPVGLLWFAFAVLTWTARPLFALTLRFDPVGRLALPEEEIKASNWAIVCLITAAVSLIAGIVLLILYGNVGFLVLAVVALSMLVPVSGVFRADPGWGRRILAAYSVLLALCGLGAAISAAIGGWGMAATVVLGIIYLVGWFVYAQIANLLIILTGKS